MLEGAHDVGVSDQPAEARVLQRSGERRSHARLIPRNGTRGSDALVRMTLRASDGSRDRRESKWRWRPSRDRCAWARIPGQGVADIRAARGCAYVPDVPQIERETPTLGG
jgi:hypothetical protein